MQSKGEDGAVGRKTWAAAGSIHLKDTGMNVKEALGTQVELTSAFFFNPAIWVRHVCLALHYALCIANLAMHDALCLCVFRVRVLTVTGYGCCFS
jgi:hypothetical protein